MACIALRWNMQLFGSAVNGYLFTYVVCIFMCRDPSLFTETKSAEEMVQRASLIATHTPRANPILSGAHLHNPPYMNKSDENVTVDFGNNYDTGSLSDFNVGLHMKRMITKDARPLARVEESEASTAGRGLYTPRMSVQVWDGHQEKAFKVMRASDNPASDEKDYV